MKKVKLEDLFELEQDWDGSITIKVKPLFSKKNIQLFTELFRIGFVHTFKGEESLSISSFVIKDSGSLIRFLTEMKLVGFLVKPIDEKGANYGELYVTQKIVAKKRCK